MTLSQTKVQGLEGGGWIWEASDYLFSKTLWLRGCEREVGAEDGLRVPCPSAMLDGEGGCRSRRRKGCGGEDSEFGLGFVKLEVVSSGDIQVGDIQLEVSQVWFPTSRAKGFRVKGFIQGERDLPGSRRVGQGREGKGKEERKDGWVSGRLSAGALWSRSLPTDRHSSAVDQDGQSTSKWGQVSQGKTWEEDVAGVSHY